jgi:hypothetical protein
MNQHSNVIVYFRDVSLKDLQPTESGHCNPYLKYAYSVDWQFGEGQVYSTTKTHTTEPHWHQSEMPPIEFTASLKTLMKESVALHVTHAGTFSHVTLARCNVRYRMISLTNL